jgi:hypothetical protein
MPNLRVESKGKLHHGVLVCLRHGRSISWDGRVIRHCTSVTNHGVGENDEKNYVYGWFHAAKDKPIKQAIKNGKK